MSSGNVGIVNTTIYNGSSPTIYNVSSTEEKTYSVPMICGIIAVSLCSILCTSFALNILNRCRKLSFQIRFVSNNLLASFITFDSSVILHSLAMLFMGDVYLQQIFDSRLFFANVLVTTLWGSLCAVTIERLLALTMPLHYSRHVTKFFLSISTVSLWTVNVLVPTLVFIINWITVCGYEYISCDSYALFLPLGIITSAFLILYSLIVFSSYIKIVSIIFQHHKLGRTLNANTKYLAEISQKQKLTDSTKTVAAIIIAFMVFQSPIYFHTFVIGFKPEFRQHKLRMLFQLLDYAGVELNIYATLYLYIWKLKECKMHFYFVLSKFNKKYKSTADALHIEVFDIIITKNKHRKKITINDSKLCNMRFLSHQRAARNQTSLCNHTISPKSFLFIYTK